MAGMAGFMQALQLAQSNPERFAEVAARAGLRPGQFGGFTPSAGPQLPVAPVEQPQGQPQGQPAQMQQALGQALSGVQAMQPQTVPPPPPTAPMQPARQLGGPDTLRQLIAMLMGTQAGAGPAGAGGLGALIRGQ